MAAFISDSRAASAGIGVVVASGRGLAPGRNGHFDLALVRKRDGNYLIEAYMDLQFFFYDGSAGLSWPAGASPRWTLVEKEHFMREWHRLVRAAWCRPSIGALRNGKAAGISFAFRIQLDGFMWDHFEIGVTKVPPGHFRTSSVRRAVFADDVTLDSNDIRPKTSGQYAVVHEFGHMIGLPDEYKSSSPHAHDHGSIMHGGTTVRSRQFQYFLSWADARV